MVPLRLELLVTAYVAVLVPVYWQFYGPANFLWFSDLALLLGLAALWLESPLLASMQALSVGLLELVWLADFLARLLVGVHLVGLSRYMFRPEVPRFLRGLSLFHVWLPVLLFWLVGRLGYDLRALPAQTILAWMVLLGCYRATKPADNVNWVFGWGDKPQRWLPPRVYLLLLMAVLPFGIYWPTHCLLLLIFPRPDGNQPIPGRRGRVRLNVLPTPCFRSPGFRLNWSLAFLRTGGRFGEGSE